MRIGVDASCFGSSRGYGRFARELLEAMATMAPEHEFVCLGDQGAFEAWTYAAPNVRRVLVGVNESPTVAARSNSNRSVADMLKLTRALRSARCDVFFSPTVYSYFPLPLGSRAVITVMDTIVERFPELTLPTRRARMFWRLKVAMALQQARLVLTISDYSARSIASVLGVRRERIRVAVPAPSASYRPAARSEVGDAAARAGLPGDARWFVYVGGFNPHKRVDAIIRAHAAIARTRESPPHLVLVGKTGGEAFLTEYDRLRALVADEGTESIVHWTGFLPDEEVARLTTGAVAALLPSECEGFGLPAVEAAACGTPVIATRESPLPELLDGGGIFIAPGSREDLQHAMELLLDNDAYRAKLASGARQRALALSWEQCARDALDAIYEAAA